MHNSKLTLEKLARELQEETEACEKVSLENSTLKMDLIKTNCQINKYQRLTNKSQRKNGEVLKLRSNYVRLSTQFSESGSVVSQKNVKAGSKSASRLRKVKSSKPGYSTFKLVKGSKES